MFRTPLFALALASATLAANVDYSALPPSPSELFMQARSCAISLPRAIEIAQEASGGRVIGVEMRTGGGGYVLDAVDRETRWSIVVDGKTGAVMSTTEVPSLPGEPVKGEWVTLPSGVRYATISEGEGEALQGVGVVTANYTGWLVDGKMFDTTDKPNGQPLVYPLQQLIPGWREGFQGVKPGGKRKIIIPGHMAYGKAGRPGLIPPNAMLIFDVELLKFEPDAASR